MASSGSTAWQSATIRSGRMGEAWMSKFGRVNSSQAAFHLAMSACQAFSASPRLGARRSTSVSIWRRKVRASARMATSGG